jgi:hypothetical protein
MEKFMYLFVENGMPASTPSPDQMQAEMQKWFAWIDKLKAEDRYVGGEPLIPQGKIIKGSKKIVTDGPFTESKELVSGFFIVNAKNLAEASELAKDCPVLNNNGTVLVRPIRKVDM